MALLIMLVPYMIQGRRLASLDRDMETVKAEIERYNDQVAEVKDVFVYPNRGQSTEQTSKDRYECYLWAVDQTGFDPSSGESGDANGYRRALGACLEGRGYTVK